jgi:uncharacterized protein (TIGR03118 family)
VAAVVSPDEALPEANPHNSEIRGEEMHNTKNPGPTSAVRLASAVALALLTVALTSLPAFAQKSAVTYLTSDISLVAPNTDPTLVNPWGLSISPSGPWWVSDNGTGLSTLYNSSGVNQGLVVTIPTGSGSGTGTPSGTVFNGTTDFKVNGQVAAFLFDTEDGTISGWYGGSNAFIAVNNHSSGAVYKGMALASAGGNNYIYVTNFHAGTVEVYDKNFAAHSFGSNAFVDTTVPTGFAPFNVQLIGTNKLVVTYAKQDAQKHDDVSGPGNGYVDVYDTEGNLQLRLAHVLYMNSPWGVALAPANFGAFNNDILIGMFGSGAIAAFNPSTGAWVGNLLDLNDLTLKLDGLWAIAFGNGGAGGPTSVLYYTAGTFKEAHGIFGSVVPHQGP